VKNSVLKVVVLFVSFWFGINVNAYYLHFVHPLLFNKAHSLPSNKVELLSFESVMNSCGPKRSTEVFKVSDGSEVTRVMKTLDSKELLEQEVKKLFEEANEVLEKKQILDPKTNQIELKATAIFNFPKQETTKLAIIKTHKNHLIVLYAPTLWHAQNFEYYLSKN
jgi:hypothetical protein